MNNTKTKHRKKLKISLTQSTLVVFDMVREAVRRIYGASSQILNINIRELKHEDIFNGVRLVYWAKLELIHPSLGSNSRILVLSECLIRRCPDYPIWRPDEIIIGEHSTFEGIKPNIKLGQLPQKICQFRCPDGQIGGMFLNTF